jgi:hypothetical protein
VYTPGKHEEGPPEPVTLVLGDVGAWEALDRLCQAAKLTCSVRDARTLVLTEGEPRTHAIGHAGPFRFQATAWNQGRTTPILPGPDESGPVEKSELWLVFSGHPGMPLLSLGSPRFVEAEDADGRPVKLSPTPRTPARLELFHQSFTPKAEWISLHSGKLPPGPFKRLRGVLPVEMTTRRHKHVVVAEPENAAGRTVAGEDGTQMTILSAFRQGANLVVRVRVTGIPDESDRPSYGFSLSEDLDRGHRPTFTWTAARRRQWRPEDVALLAAAPQMGLAGAPWIGLALHAEPATKQWETTLTIPLTQLRGAPLVLYSFHRERADLPFELHDVPGP